MSYLTVHPAQQVTLYLHFSPFHYYPLIVSPFLCLPSITHLFIPSLSIFPLSIIALLSSILTTPSPTQCLFIFCLRPVYFNNVVCVRPGRGRKQNGTSSQQLQILHSSDLILKNRQTDAQARTQQVNESFSKSENQAASLSLRNSVWRQWSQHLLIYKTRQ